MGMEAPISANAIIIHEVHTEALGKCVNELKAA